MFISILGILAIIMNILGKTHGNINDETQVFGSEDKVTLFDFTTKDSTDDWIEQSDTVREVGMSKAIFTMQRTRVFSRAILFTLLNPQPNGAGFAGVRIMKTYNLEPFNNISLKLRGQGENKNYKIVLRHKYLNNEPNPTYEQFFTAPFDEFGIVSLPFDNFKAYYRGKPVENAEPLDTSEITSIGIQVHGGVYLEKKQKGSSTLEIDWIKALV